MHEPCPADDGRRPQEEPNAQPARAVAGARARSQDGGRRPGPTEKLILTERRISMLQAYVEHVAERAALGIPPLPLSAKQTAEVIDLMKAATAADGEFLLNLLTYRVPAGVDDAAKVKASYLAAVAHGTEKTLLL